MNGIGLEPAILGNLENAIIAAIPCKGLVITDKNGNPAKLAVIDDSGNVLESGESVCAEIEGACITAYKKILFDKGFIKVYCPPEKPRIAA
jgi:hypothetical protein